MAEGFWRSLSQHLLFWSGWVFTIGGTAASLWWGWSGALFVLVGLLSLTTFAYQKHREKHEAEGRHSAEKSQLQADLRTARERAEQAERKLNEISADLLRQLQAIIRAHAFEGLANRLGRHADYVVRMVNLAQVISKPLALRTFAKRAGALYAEGKLSPTGQQELREEDPFFLVFTDPNGLVTRRAFLRVHQMDARKELVWFRIVRIFGEEMAYIDSLAERQEVPGKGYSARPVCEPSRYADQNLGPATEVLRQLTEDIIRLSRIDT